MSFWEFANNGIYFQIFAIAFGTLFILFSRNQILPSKKDLASKSWMERALFKYNLQFYSGVVLVAVGIIVILFKLVVLRAGQES